MSPLAGTFYFLFTSFLPFPTRPILCPSLASVYCLTLLSAGIIEVSHRPLQRCRLFTNQQDFNKGLAVSRKLAQSCQKLTEKGRSKQMVVECLSNFGKMDGATRSSVAIVSVKSHMKKQGEKQELFLCSVAAAPMTPAQEVIPAKAH